TPGACQAGPGPRGSGGSVFVTKLTPMGSALIYSTCLGGLGFQEGLGIAVDAAGNAYVAGRTNSLYVPTTPGAFQPNFGGCPELTCFENAFVTKLDPTGSALIYSTYLGGPDVDYGKPSRSMLCRTRMPT